VFAHDGFIRIYLMVMKLSSAYLNYL